MTENTKRRSVVNEVVKEWSERSSVGVFTRRKVPRAEWKKEPPIWKCKRISGETR